jgi:hypothetical protein
MISSSTITVIVGYMIIGSIFLLMFAAAFLPEDLDL